MPQTIDLEKEMAKQQAQQDAAMQAEQEIKKQQAEAAVLNYQEKRKELESKRDSAQKESYQSGVEVRKDTIGRMVPVSPGASKGRLVFEDQVFPIMSTRLTPEGQAQYDEAVSQLTSLDQDHQSKLSDSFYKSSYDSAATAQNIKTAESKLEELKNRKAALEAQPYENAAKGMSSQQRRDYNERIAKKNFEISQLDSQIKQAESYLQTKSANPLSLATEPYQEIRYSSPSNAVGYNSLTGRVEIGAFGAGGAQVVSQSKAEDIMDLQRIGKEAGYTKGATIDPRIGVFKTVDSGILTPGLKAQPSPEIVRQFSGSPQPQRTRPNILTNQPDSEYANPSFVTKDQQRKADELNQFVKGSASALPEDAETFSLTFADGSKIEGLTKQQAQEYVKTFKLGQDVAKLQRQTQRAEVVDFLKEAKAQGFTLLDVTKDGRKETMPIDSAFGRIITGGEARISYQDPKLRQARIDFVETRRAQKKWIKEVEKSGAGFISITTATGAKVVPVSEAWAEIRKAPLDAKISTKLPVAEKSIGPDQQTRDIMKFEQGRRAISQDPLSQLTYASEKQKTDTILPGGAGEFEREIGTQALSFVSGVVNLAENVDVGIRRGVGNMFKTPESKLSKFPEPSAQLYVAPSYEAAYLGAAQEGLSKSAKPTDIGFGIKVPLPTLQTFGIAGKMLSDYEKTQSPNKLLAQKSFAALQFADPAIVPLRQVKIATALETRVPTLIGAPRLSSKVTDVAKGLKIGYSPEVSRLELVKIKDGPVVAGVPRPDKIPQLEKVRGLEGRGGYPITEDTSGYMTRKPTLEYLTKKGVLQKDEADILQQAKPYLAKAGKYKDEVKRTTLPSQPVLSLEEGKETTAAFKKLESEQFKKNPTVGSLFGSTTEQFYVLDEFVEKSRDIDIHPMGRNAGPKAQKIAREFAQDIQDVARPERQFAVKESFSEKINPSTGIKTGEKEIDRVTISVGKSDNVFVTKRKILEGEEFDTKVSEFIVKSADDKASGYGTKATDANKVMGFDVPDKSITVKGVKIGEYTGKQKIQTLRRQELRRLSAGFELQFEKTELGSLRADPGREKEYAKIYAIAKTREAQAIKQNKMDDARLFSDYAESVKSFAEKRGIWKTGQYVDLADDAGILTNPSLAEKTIDSLISTSKTASKSPTTLLSSTTHKNQYPSPEKDSPSFSTLNKSSSKSVLKYSSSSDVLRPTQSTLSRIKRVQSESTISPRTSRSSKPGSELPSSLNQRSPRSAIPSNRPQNYGRYNPPSKTPYGRSPPSATPSRIPSTIPSRSIITGPPSKIPNMTVKPLKPVIPLYSETVPPKQIKIVTPPLIKTRTDKQKPNKPKGREDFFGSSHAADVLGFRTKKKEFDYGDEKTARLVEQDIKLTTAGRDAFVRSGRKKNNIVKTKKNILAPEKSKTFSKAGKWKGIW